MSDPSFSGRVRRRTLLSGAVGAVAALAGCPGDASTTTPTPSSTATRERDSLAAFRSALVSAAIDVETVAYTDSRDAVALTYTSADPSSRDTVTTEVGKITGEFYNSIDDGLDVQRLDATVIGPDGADQVTWHAEREWYRELQNGEISASELTGRVINTVERV